MLRFTMPIALWGDKWSATSLLKDQTIRHWAECYELRWWIHECIVFCLGFFVEFIIWKSMIYRMDTMKQFYSPIKKVCFVCIADYLSSSTSHEWRWNPSGSVKSICAAYKRMNSIKPQPDSRWSNFVFLVVISKFVQWWSSCLSLD